MNSELAAVVAIKRVQVQPRVRCILLPFRRLRMVAPSPTPKTAASMWILITAGWAMNSGMSGAWGVACRTDRRICGPNSTAAVTPAATVSRVPAARLAGRVRAKKDEVTGGLRRND